MSFHFPLLPILARIKYAFSVENNVLSLHKNKIYETTVQALLYCQMNLGFTSKMFYDLYVHNMYLCMYRHMQTCIYIHTFIITFIYSIGPTLVKVTQDVEDVMHNTKCTQPAKYKYIIRIAHKILKCYTNFITYSM